MVLMPHLLFLGNVASHWVALMSGIASVIIALYETVKKSPIVARAFWLVALVCTMAACDQAWQDEHRNTQAAEADKAAQSSLANTCRENARVEHALYVGSQGLVGSQRETIDSQRGTIDKQQLSIGAQQRDVSSCVVSLGKMNPVVRRQIRVVLIPFGYVDAASGLWKSRFAPQKSYLTEIVITTNEDQVRPAGYLRCTSDFRVIGPAQLPFISSMAMTTSETPIRISDHEYQLNVVNTGSYWGPSTPIYLPVLSDVEALEGCAFTPQ